MKISRNGLARAFFTRGSLIKVSRERFLYKNRSKKSAAGDLPVKIGQKSLRRAVFTNKSVKKVLSERSSRESRAMETFSHVIQEWQRREYLCKPFQESREQWIPSLHVSGNAPVWQSRPQKSF
jgi:hypothetical protein